MHLEELAYVLPTPILIEVIETWSIRESFQSLMSGVKENWACLNSENWTENIEGTQLVYTLQVGDLNGNQVLVDALLNNSEFSKRCFRYNIRGKYVFSVELGWV